MATRRRPPRAWIELMSREDVGRAWELAANRTEAEIVAMARERMRKDQLIALWFVASCIVPIVVGFIMILQPVSAVVANPWPWLLAGAAALLLPVPAMKIGKEGQKEGRIITLAFWLNKDPNFLSKDR